MGVYIKDMEMPTRCADCWMMDGADMWCIACRGRYLCQEYRYGIKDRPDWCPLVPVPPHGRLIDADALPWEHRGIMLTDPDEWGLKEWDIEHAPTVIEAEEE